MLVRSVITLALLGCASAALAGTRVLIEIADTSAYRISHAQLAELIPDLGEIDSARLALSVGGETRTLHVEDGGDGRFGPGDHLSFFGERLHGQQGWFDTYAVHNVYTLTINADGTANAHPTPASAGGPGGSAAHLRRQLHLEEENLQIRLSNRWVEPGDEPDLWHWAKLTHVDPSPFQAPFALPGLGGAGEVRLRLGFRGLSEVRLPFGRTDLVKPADHVVEVRINGELVQTTSFESRAEHEIEFSLPATVLQAQDNLLELRVPQRPMPEQDSAIVDVVMFNYLHLDFPITGQLDETPLPIHVERSGPVQLQASSERSLRLYGRDGSRHEGRRNADQVWQFDLVAGEYQPVADDHYGVPAALRLAAETRWREVELGYDYLLITHPSLAEASRPLADHHRNNGLRVAEVDVLDLYDEFNHGVVHPRAIRDFIAHAHHHWPQPQPRFVLLVGDASFDIRSDRVDDNRYAKWVGRELTIPGQFGVIPGGEYEDGAKIGAARNLIPTWQYPSEEGHSASDNFFVAVNEDDWLPRLAIGRFPVVEPHEVSAIVDKTLRYATSTDFGDWRRRALFTSDTSQHLQNTSAHLSDTLVDQGFDSSLVFPDREASDNLPQINALNDALNEGQLLVHFIGHGGRYIWRTGPPDPERNHDLFTLDHVAGLTNADRLPMVLSMTCYSAPFDHPSADSIGERFLREPNRGAIAVFAASWRNSPLPAFSEAAITELMTPGTTIGEALMTAKHAVPNQHQRTLVETYNLLGDPAVVLQRPNLPFTAQVRNGVHPPVVDLLIDRDQAVNGHAVLEWLDDSGAVVSTTRRELRGTRASIAKPNTANGARDVRVHLVDRRSRSDGVARVHLDLPDIAPVEATEPSGPADAPAGPPRVRTHLADRIFTSGTVLSEGADAAGNH